MGTLGDEIDLISILAIFWKRRNLILVVLTGSILFSLYTLWRTSVTYKAEATILPISSEGGVLSALSQSLPLMVGGQSGLTSERVQYILESRRLSQQVVVDLDLVRYLEERGKLKLKNKAATYQEKVGAAASTLRKALEIKNMKAKGVMAISVIWDDADWAAKITNDYVESLGQFLNTRSLSFNFQVVDVAIPPEKKHGPIIRQMLMNGIIMGMLLGIALATVLEFLEKFKVIGKVMPHKMRSIG